MSTSQQSDHCEWIFMLLQTYFAHSFPGQIADIPVNIDPILF
jgi:hypothetical protein